MSQAAADSLIADSPAPHSPVAAAAAVLEFALAPDDASRLTRLPALVALRAGRAHSSGLELVWHDTPEGALAEQGLSLCARHSGRQRRWRLERPAPSAPGAGPAQLAESASPESLPVAHVLAAGLPAPLLPVAAFAGRLRTLPLGAAGGGVSVKILQGRLRAVAGEHPVCRVRLSGPPDAVGALAEELAPAARLRVPDLPLAFAALATAGRAVPPRALGAPMLAADMSVGDAFAHIVGHLAGALQHWAPAAVRGEATEPVHQMRVALRRLRSATALFRRAVNCPALEMARTELKALGQRLGPARDWDVFIGETAGSIAERFPDEATITRLMATAARRRTESYTALREYLEGPPFCALLLRLACLAVLRPWQRLPPPAEGDAVAEQQAQALAGSLADYAAHALRRRWRNTLAPGADLSGLSGEELHALRIQCKRLRYAAEFFAPLFSARDSKRFIRRLSILQEQLGLLNDGSVASHLMAELGGIARGYAAGLVIGHVTATQPKARAEVIQAWRKFRRLEPFWP
jgi:CHAD domain-containing protein